jgi:hypothetical protein
LVKIETSFLVAQNSLYYVTVEAKDRAAAERPLTATTTLTVHVGDSDDQGPVFSHPLYTATIRRGATSGTSSGASLGALDIRPDKIQAQDQDSLRFEYELDISYGQLRARIT